MQNRIKEILPGIEGEDAHNFARGLGSIGGAFGGTPVGVGVGSAISRRRQEGIDEE